MSKARQLAQKPSQPTGRKNLIINGAMNVAQRGTTHTSASGYTLDRFNFYNQSGSGVADVTQETDVPSGEGFANSLKVDITTADTSNTAFEEVTCTQTIEAQDLQHLQYNTSSAKELTLSFWVKSNKTGDYVVWFYVEDAGDHYSDSYTINTANTWEKKTISIPAKTSGGGPANDNGAGLAVAFILLAGDSYKSGTMPSGWETLTNANRYVDQAVNLFDSTSNDWYITGVQLEVGSTATEFEHLSYGEELVLCQRYFRTIGKQATEYELLDRFHGDADRVAMPIFETPMRILPAATFINYGDGTTGELDQFSNGIDVSVSGWINEGPSGGGYLNLGSLLTYPVRLVAEFNAEL